MTRFRFYAPVLICLPFAGLHAQDAPKPAAPAQTAQTPPAPKPKADAPDSEREDFSIGIFGWYNPSHFHLRNGQGAVSTANPADLNYGGKNQPTPGIEFSAPAGKYNALRISYFRTQGHGATVTPIAIRAFDQDYASGTSVSTKYKMQEAKVSWEYLSWPYPASEKSFRFKTLWGAQFISMDSTLDAPIYDAANNTDTTAVKKHWLIYPSLGVGIEKRFSRNLKWELKGEGFALPSRTQLWDAQTDVAIRGSRIEVLIGGRVLHFRTSPQKPEYIYATMPGGFVEFRWHL